MPVVVFLMFPLSMVPGMPPIKETILQVGMSSMQKDYYRKLLQ